MEDLSDECPFLGKIINIDAAITIFWRIEATFFSKK
jgi:hypothetical protein